VPVRRRSRRTRRDSGVVVADHRKAVLVASGRRGGYPGAGGGLWLRMIFPPGLVTWLVPSGKTVSVQPIWCRTTWWCQQQ
jgi:hypothetical protein